MSKQKKEETVDYEIRNQAGKLLFVGSEELYTKIITDVITQGCYTHTFDIFDGKLSATFRSLTESKRTELLKHVKSTFDVSNEVNLEAQANNDTLALAYYLQGIKMDGVEVPVASKQNEDVEAKMNGLKALPSAVVDKLIQYYTVFSVLMSRAFNSDDVVKNS